MIRVRGQLTCDVCLGDPLDVWLDLDGAVLGLVNGWEGETAWQTDTKRSYQDTLRDERRREEFDPSIAPLLSDLLDERGGAWANPEMVTTCSSSCRKVYEAQLRLASSPERHTMPAGRVPILKHTTPSPLTLTTTSGGGPLMTAPVTITSAEEEED